MVTRGQLTRIATKLKAKSFRTVVFRIPYSTETDRVEAMKAKAIRENNLNREGILTVFVVDYSLAA